MAEEYPPESIHQQFAYGIRFVTELVYRVQGANGRRRYRRLLREPSPLVPHHVDEGGAWTCVALAVAILSETEVKPVQDVAPDAVEGPEQVAAMLSQRLPAHKVQVSGPELLPYWGGIAGTTLQSKGLALLQLVEKSRVRWSLVVGSESCTAYGFPITQRPAMLLMDMGYSPVWGVGHNARLAPAGPWNRLQRPEGPAPLQLRILDGGLIPVSPGALVTIDPRRLS